MAHANQDHRKSQFSRGLDALYQCDTQERLARIAFLIALLLAIMALGFAA